MTPQLSTVPSFSEGAQRLVATLARFAARTQKDGPDLGRRFFRSVPTRGTWAKRATHWQHPPVSLRERCRTVRNQAADFSGRCRQGEIDETRDSDSAVPIPRPLSEAPRVRRGAFGDGERGGRRRPGRIPGARRTGQGSARAAPGPRHPDRRAARARLGRLGRRLRPVRPVFALDPPRKGRRQGHSARGRSVPGLSYRRSRSRFGRAGRSPPRCFRPDRLPPCRADPTSGGRDEGGRS